MPLFFHGGAAGPCRRERFGKVVRIAGPGLQRNSPFVDAVAGRMSLQVEQLDADNETKTKDNVQGSDGLVALTQNMDTIRSVGEYGNMGRSCSLTRRHRSVP